MSGGDGKGPGTGTKSKRLKDAAAAAASAAAATPPAHGAKAHPLAEKLAIQLLANQDDEMDVTDIMKIMSRVLTDGMDKSKRLETVEAEIRQIWVELENAEQARNQATAKAEQATKDCKAMKKANDGLKAEVAKKEQEILELKDSIETMGRSQEAVKQAVEETKVEANERTYNIEKKACAANLIIKFVPLTNDGEDETKQQTKEQVNKILKRIKVDKEVKVKDCFRFRRRQAEEGEAEEGGARNGGRDPPPPVILVKLESASMKGRIFKNLKKLQRSPFSHISVNNEVPASFRKIVWEREQVARQLRLTYTGLKTKVEIVKGIALIKVKEEGAENGFEFWEETKHPLGEEGEEEEEEEEA